MLGDELFQTPLLRMCWNAFNLNGEAAPVIAEFPPVLSRLIHPFHVGAVLHRKVSVVLPVYEASARRNRSPGHDFGNENNPSSILAAFFATNVEAQVYLIEIGMERN